MMYQNILKSKWDNLIAELKVELRNKGDLMTVARLNDWYKVKAFQFRSISSVDSIQLEQAGSKEFVQEFRNTLEAFSFSEPDSSLYGNTPPMWQGLLLGAVAAVVSFFVVKPFTFLVIAVIVSVVTFGATVTAFHSKIRTKALKNNQTVKYDHYVRQMSDHLNQLTKVCDKYGVK